MTKLEEKLIELGYQLDVEKQEINLCGVYIYRQYLKPYNKYFHLKIIYELTTKSINYAPYPIKTPKFKWQNVNYNKLNQQAFNQLQKDLEVLKDEKLD